MAFLLEGAGALFGGVAGAAVGSLSAAVNGRSPWDGMSEGIADGVAIVGGAGKAVGEGINASTDYLPIVGHVKAAAQQHIFGNDENAKLAWGRANIGTAVVGTAVVVAAAADEVNKRYQESKDRDLPEVEKFAALCAAAYQDNIDTALQVMHENVSSGNWCVDPELSGKYQKVFYNRGTGEAVIAYRGTATWCDVRQTWVPIVFGFEGTTQRFHDAKCVAESAIQKYGKDKVTLTGHSVGGSEADWVNAQLGCSLRTIEINPFIFGRYFNLFAKKSCGKVYRVRADPASLLAGNTTKVPQQVRNPHSIDNFR